MFVLKDDKSLVEMKPAEFDSEDDFQALIENYPALLCGTQINSSAPRKWILVKREMPISSEEGGNDRFSLDHLFLDQDGIPTLVEVKRKDDTRLRREVVGQMLDYAANGVAYWPVDELRTLVQLNFPESAIAEILEEPELDVEQYWQRVKTNLQAGKVRLLFLADYIPPELKRVVEFLNKQMDPAEVLALELKLFKSESGLRTLVPRIYGQTEETQQKKSSGGGRQPRNWTEESVYKDLGDRCGEEAVLTAMKITDWIKAKADQISFGHGKVNGSIGALFVRREEKYSPLQLSSNGVLFFNFGFCVKGPFLSKEKRIEWLKELNQNCSLGFPEDLNDKFPQIPLEVFKDEKRLQGLFKAMDWFASELPSPEME